jgi:regulator of protease activity HflC (stomatin/prohibitin superfamily)
VEKVYTALHAADPSTSALAHRYLETLPEIANGEASKVWVVPSELTSVVQGLKEGFTK